MPTIKVGLVGLVGHAARSPGGLARLVGLVSGLVQLVGLVGPAWAG